MNDPLLSYLPDLYFDIREFVELMATEDVEFASLQTAVDRLFDDQFVLTSSEDAVRRRERMLGILADKTIETLSFRRTRIINRFSTKPPFTIRYLQERLDFVTGAPGLVLAELDVQHFTLKVSVGVENAAVLRELQYTIDTLKPANLIYQPTTYSMDRIEILDTAFSVGLDRKTKFDGSWHLGGTPFAVRREEVPL